MFEGFDTFDIALGEITLHGVRGGDGPPLLLLHGYPQTHAMWHKVAPDLARDFTVIAPDLRGYGRSSKPVTDATHSPYSKRAMAADMVTLMAQFGFDQFDVGAHDRGARVAHRLGMDYPDAVRRMCLLDIAPTREMYASTDDEFARAYWHWFFLIQPHPFPETMIAADPQAYLNHKTSSWGAGHSHFSDDAMADYSACWTPDTIHAACEDYRAAATLDIDHDNADGDAKLTCPLHVLWGRKGIIERCFDALALWRLRAETVTGHAVPTGHYIAEERPDLVLAEFRYFFDACRK